MIVDPTVERAVDSALDRVGQGGTLMILATYTTLLEARNGPRGDASPPPLPKA